MRTVSNLLVVLILFTLPLKATPLSVTFDYETIDGRPTLYIQAQSQNLRIVSMNHNDKGEVKNFSKFKKATSYQEGLPEDKLIQTWLQNRYVRQQNFSCFHLYKVQSIKDNNTIGYIDFAQMSTTVGKGGYNHEEHGDIIKLWKDLGVNDSEDDFRQGLAIFIPIFLTRTDPELQTEAFKLSLDLLQLISPHFTLPALNNSVLSDELPEHWELILANIDFQVQIEIASQSGGKMSVDHRRMLMCSQDRFEHLFKEVFQGERQSLSTIMPGETDRIASQMIGILSPENPKTSSLLDAGFEEHQSSGYGSFYGYTCRAYTAFLYN
jgi:hypothetical protein